MVVGLGEFAGIDRSGLYVLRAPCLSSPMIYKVGKTLNLRKRLDQYQLYFPFGFLVDLLWIFPRGLGNGRGKLDKAEKFIQARLDMIQTTTRRSKVEWYKNTKIEIVDTFILAFDNFSDIGGQLVNPATPFAISDLTPAEARKNARESERMQAAAAVQLARIKSEHPDDFAFLCNCSNWAIDKTYRSR